MTGHTTDSKTSSHKVIRGRPYSIGEFARKYRLDDDEAKRLLQRLRGHLDEINDSAPSSP